MDNGTLSIDLTGGRAGRRVKARTSPCIQCGAYSYVILLEQELTQYQAGTFVQDAFPNLTPAERDLILLGLHVECGEKMSAWWRDHQ